MTDSPGARLAPAGGDAPLPSAVASTVVAVVEGVHAAHRHAHGGAVVMGADDLLPIVIHVLVAAGSLDVCAALTVAGSVCALTGQAGYYLTMFQTALEFAAFQLGAEGGPAEGGALAEGGAPGESQERRDAAAGSADAAGDEDDEGEGEEEGEEEGEGEEDEGEEEGEGEGEGEEDEGEKETGDLE
jgi:hypothetical protein